MLTAAAAALPCPALQAVSLTGRILGKSPLRVLPSKTAIVPVNKELMPRSPQELERCSRTVYVANIDKKVEREDVRGFFEHLCGGQGGGPGAGAAVWQGSGSADGLEQCACSLDTGMLIAFHSFCIARISDFCWDMCGLLQLPLVVMVLPTACALQARSLASVCWETLRTPRVSRLWSLLTRRAPWPPSTAAAPCWVSDMRQQPGSA